MGEVLFELDQVLRAKKYNMTVQERNTLLNCKSKAIKDYTVGALFGAGVAWIGTSKLSMFGRIGIAAGASAAVGLWRLGTSLDSSIDQILTLQESSMQRELASIVVKKYWNDPWRMQLISKHFYSERVFDDSNVDLPKVRWRFRNFFSDDGSLSQTTHGSDSHGESQSASRGDYNSNTQRDPSGIRTDSRRDFEGKFKYESKQAPLLIQWIPLIAFLVIHQWRRFLTLVTPQPHPLERTLVTIEELNVGVECVTRMPY
uniref:Uncharacterized protein n=1 Tax=Cannabis sativa TaxID=3483 RepID=A0ABL6VYB0_CANSA